MPKIKKNPRVTNKSGTKSTTPKSNGQAESKKKSGPHREVIYPDIKFKLFAGDDSLTDEKAKEFLGWTEVPKGADYDFQDEHEKYIKLIHNVTNRKFEMSICKVYVQCILQGKWELNLETMIVGRSGLVISAQHRMVALILACQIWEKCPEDWPVWKTRPTIECVIALGCDESDRVVNTVDTGRSRSFADVIYRSKYFAGMDNQTRDKLGKYLSDAVKVIEQRTLARVDAFSSIRPHSEGLEFLDNHLTLLKCVKHIYEEHGKNARFRLYLSPGYAAGLMYLMSAGKTDDSVYVESYPRSESNLDLSNHSKAADFFVMLAQGAKELEEVKKYATKLRESFARALTKDEGTSLLIKAWIPFSDDKPVAKDLITLSYKTDDETGEKHLADYPTVGGIDKGRPDLVTDDSDSDDDNPSPEEIDQRSEQVREESFNKKNGKGKKKGPTPKENDKVFVEQDGGVWEGTITEIYDGPTGKIAKVRDKKTKRVDEAPLDCCHLTNPQSE